MGNRLLIGVAAGIVLLFAAGCGGSNQATGPQGSAPASGGGATTASGAAADSCSSDSPPNATQVEMASPHQFQPADVTVSAGSTVTWTNNTTLNHTVTFDGGPACGIVLIGHTVSVTFNTPGTYHYVDDIFPQYMSGTVTVTP